MLYPKAECCPFNKDECHNSCENNISLNQADETTISNDNDTGYSQCEMMKKIQELDFSIVDLNLFLDTHPNCSEALDLFTKLSATSKSLKNDYQAKYGPLYVTKSKNSTPFEWVNACYKWPWEM